MKFNQKTTFIWLMFIVNLWVYSISKLLYYV